MAFASVLTINAQNVKCPVSGDWHNLALGGDWGESALFISSNRTTDNAYFPKRPSNGCLSYADIYFEKEVAYNLIYNKTLAENTYEFTLEYKVGKQIRKGKVQIKKSGDNLIVSGMDVATKKMPIHGKKYEKNQF